MTIRRTASAALLLVLLGHAIGGCSSDSEAGSSTPIPTAADAAGDESVTAGADEPRSSHIVLVGYDGLDEERVASPEGDLFALLASRGAAGTIGVPQVGADTCSTTWLEAMHAGGSASGAHLLDELDARASGGVDIGVFTSSADAADVLVPDAKVTTAVGASDVPGLDPWPSEKLAVEATKNEAIRHVSAVEGDSITVLHSDLLLKAADDPDAADLAPIATKTADDLVDLLISAADARPTRPDEDWMFLVAGGCGQGGQAPLLVEGDRVDEPRDLGAEPLPPAVIGGIVAAYLGVQVDGWPEPPADLISDRGRN